jgi:hypothetical protein
MDEKMNRAARRAAGKKTSKKKKLSISVRHQIAVVPMEHVEPYYSFEIARDGPRARGRELITLSPDVEIWPVDSDWFPKTLERMRATRRQNGTHPIGLTIEGMDREIDVGLVDVTVFFEMPPDVPPLPSTWADMEMAQATNLRHLNMGLSRYTCKNRT